MGLQGDNKATHDFLSLYSAAKDAALPLIPESKKAPPSQGHPWALPFATTRYVAVTSARQQQQQQQQMPPDRKAGGGFMDAGSRSSGGAGFNDNDGHAARREVSSSLKELTVRVETKGGSCSGSAGTDHLPNTPRSKHSATEQRRRSKINDRFQILREILPQNDQKRDKASFLLEVTEYIRFLQEKVQKYEVSHQEWNQEDAKVMPWSNIYFRSFWKNAQKKDEINGDAISDPSQVIKNGSSLGFPFAIKPGDGNNAAAFEIASGGQEPSEANQKGCVPYREADSLSNVPNNDASQEPAQLTKSLPTEDRAVNSEMLTDPELAIDEGTISLSSQYSQGLLVTLNQALQNSGIDLSQASISVQINLGKRAIKRPAPGANCTPKELTSHASHDQAVWHQQKLGDGALEHSQATKRHKSDR